MIFFTISCSRDQTSFSKEPTQETKTEKFSCLVGEIPEYIKNQSYKDESDNTVKYDHRSRIEEICKLRDNKKELYLIVGRGNAESMSTAGNKYQSLDTNNGKRVWVYGEIDGAKMAKNGTPHLWMDFSDEASMKSIPENLLDAIAFDWSVSIGIPTTIPLFYRILRPGGKLYIDKIGVKGFAFADLPKFQQYCQNRKKFTTNKGRKYCLNLGESTILVQGGLLSGDDEKDINKTVELLTSGLLRKVFGPNRCETKTTGYPVAENKAEYFECEKRKDDNTEAHEKRNIYYKKIQPALGEEFDSVIKAFKSELGKLYEFIQCDDGNKPCEEVDITEPVIVLESWGSKRRVIPQEVYGKNNNHVLILITELKPELPLFAGYRYPLSAHKGSTIPVVNIKDGTFLSGKEALLNELALW